MRRIKLACIAEAAEVDLIRQTELLRRLIQMTVKQVMPIERLANFVGKDEIIWLPELRVPRPHALQGSENHAVPIKR